MSFQNDFYKYYLKKEKKEILKNTIGKDLEKMTQLFNLINRDCSLHRTSCVTTSDCQKIVVQIEKFIYLMKSH